jgi:hypothetical protein
VNVANPFDTTDIVSTDGAIVVSIEVLRDLRGGRQPKGSPCSHARVAVADADADLLCRDCGLRVNPIAWIRWAALSWKRVQSDYEAARHEHARLDLRRWAVCRCGERVYLVGRPEDEKRRLETVEGIYEEALKRIAPLNPEAAGKFAAEEARKALARARVSGKHEV